MFEKLKPAFSWVKTNIIDRLVRLYPTRQVYFRANGKVRFVSLTPAAQMVATGVVVCLFLWTGVATFTYVFMDDILAEKDQELAARQRAFEELSSDMALLEVDLQGEVMSVKAKQRYLETLLEEEATELTPAEGTEQKAGEQEAALEDESEAPYAVGGPETLIEHDADESTPAEAEAVSEPPPWQALKTWLRGLVSEDTADAKRHRSARLKAIAGQVAEMRDEQARITTRMLDLTEMRIDRLSDAITTAGLDVEKVLAAMDPVTPNAGGPIEELPDGDRLLLETDSDELFKTLLDSQDRLAEFGRIMHSFPVVKPVKDYYYVSSSFGVRRDPFTKSRAMHGGLDMASHWKTPIYATAPGTVVKAGWNGAYGRMVEIDHGNGFKTRYGHLKTILVEKGQHVTMGERVALMGSSGRSTGTHLHYEVRFLDKPYNPVKFFKAEQHVLIKPDHG